jgi:hypothetical protein
MDWSAISGRVTRLLLLLGVTLLAYVILRGTGLYAFTAREVEGLNTIILLVGNIYAVMFAFVIFVIWGQFTDVENFTMRECNSLDDLLRFSAFLNADAHHAIRRAVADYAQRVVRSEWICLGERRTDDSTEKAFTALMNAVIRAKPASAEEQVIYDRLVDIARKTGEHRDERIHKSLTRIPPTLAGLVKTMALVLLLLVFVYPFGHRLAGAACFVVVAVVLAMADLVLTDTDNPFHGICNVSAEPFANLRA